MVLEFFVFKRLGNLLNLEGKSCVEMTHLVLHLETVMKVGVAKNDIAGRNRDPGMGGIGKVISQLLNLQGMDPIYTNLENSFNELVELFICYSFENRFWQMSWLDFLNMILIVFCKIIALF
ncbi:Hypothetical predicted protein [Olea europaea subsp. europaea]|uniref:Uncharacterized protein n=1 Tax=Olea europaea subsp. europaea TaxID=158383 RepID=A0A8S0UHN6_OLEEU|nr:Hypothetical predicted protein [Olea europaea subsp. europaea]